MSLDYQRVPLVHQNFRDAWRRLGNGLNWLLNTLNPPGYGGLQLSAPTTGLGALTTTPTKIPGAAYDSVITPDPKDVTQDLANGSISLLKPGMWYVNVNLTGLIVPVTANASNTVALAFYNETLGIPGDQPAYFIIPRYGEAVDISTGVLLRAPAAMVGQVFSLYIWVLNASPTITLTDLSSLEISAFRVD